MIGCSYPQPRGRPYTGTGLGITACSLSDRVVKGLWVHPGEVLAG